MNQNQLERLSTNVYVLARIVAIPYLERTTILRVEGGGTGVLILTLLNLDNNASIKANVKLNKWNVEI